MESWQLVLLIVGCMTWLAIGFLSRWLWIKNEYYDDQVMYVQYSGDSAFRCITLPQMLLVVGGLLGLLYVFWLDATGGPICIYRVGPSTSPPELTSEQERQ